MTAPRPNLAVSTKNILLRLLLLPLACAGIARAAAELPPSPAAVRAELIRSVIAGIRQPSDLDEAAQKITALLGPSVSVTYSTSPYSTSGPPAPHDPQTAFARLAGLGRQITEGKIRTNFFAGLLAVERAVPGFTPAETYARLPELCRALRFQAAAAYLGTTAETPRDGESIEAYLDRVAATAAARGDWPLAWKALEFLGLGWRNLEWLVVQLDGVDLYLTGLGQEAAGQPADAVASYQRALLSTSPYVPAQVIGLRLAGLKNSLPESYAAGTEQAVALAVAAQSYGRRGRGGAAPLAASPSPQQLLSEFTRHVSQQLGLEPPNIYGPTRGRGAANQPIALLRRGDVVIDPMPASSPAAFLQHIIPADLVAISRDYGRGAGPSMAAYVLPFSILPGPPFVPPSAHPVSATVRGP